MFQVTFKLVPWHRLGGNYKNKIRNENVRSGIDMFLNPKTLSNAFPVVTLHQPVRLREIKLVV